MRSAEDSALAEISKHAIKQTHAYIERIHDLLETLSMDEDAKHLIDDELMDRHYQVRFTFDDLLEKTSNKSEVY